MSENKIHLSILFAVFLPERVLSSLLCAAISTAPTKPFGYYTNMDMMVQQIEFIIHTNSKPLQAIFVIEGQYHRSKVKNSKKFLLTR